MKQSTRPAAVTAAVILVLELAGAAFWGHAACTGRRTRGPTTCCHRGAGAGGAAPHAGGCRLSAAVGAGPAFLSPYSWQKKTDVASKTRQGGAPLSVGRVALRLLAAAMVVVYLALVLGGLFGRVSGLTVRVAAAAAVPAGDPRGRSVRRHESAAPRPGGAGGLNQKNAHGFRCAPF